MNTVQTSELFIESGGIQEKQRGGGMMVGVASTPPYLMVNLVNVILTGSIHVAVIYGMESVVTQQDIVHVSLV